VILALVLVLEDYLTPLTLVYLLLKLLCIYVFFCACCVCVHCVRVAISATGWPFCRTGNTTRLPVYMKFLLCSLSACVLLNTVMMAMNVQHILKSNTI